MALTLAVAVPLQAQAATNITVKNYTEMPFYDEAHLAAQAKWGSNSSVTTFGNTQTCESTYTYSGKTYDIQKAGNGVLIQNVGTDLDGDAYDIKIVANSVKGTHSQYGTVYLQVYERDPVRICIGARYKGEAKLTFSYLKHGTTKAANIKAAASLYDIDAQVLESDFSKYSDLLFNGREGVSFEGNTATCYIYQPSAFKVDQSKGTFCYNAGQIVGGACTGKDIKGAVTATFDSSTFTMTYSSYYAGITMWFDSYENPGNPSKSAVITG